MFKNCQGSLKVYFSLETAPTSDLAKPCFCECDILIPIDGEKNKDEIVLSDHNQSFDALVIFLSSLIY